MVGRPAERHQGKAVHDKGDPGFSVCFFHHQRGSQLARDDAVNKIYATAMWENTPGITVKRFKVSFL